MNFKVTITETPSREISVSADTIEDAEAIASSQYYDEDIILDAEDFVSVTFTAKET